MPLRPSGTHFAVECAAPLQSANGEEADRVRHLFRQRNQQAVRRRACALSDVDFDVVEGKVNGLVGANGAGKSTLLKIIAGALPPDAGEMRLDGRPLAMTSITDAARAGIAIVSQELSLFPALSVEENLLLAPGGRAWRARRAFGRSARTTFWRSSASPSRSRRRCTG